MKSDLENVLLRNRQGFHKIVDFDPAKDRLFPFDFTAANKELTPEDIVSTEKFSAYIINKLSATGSKYGIGGYQENRTLYSKSRLFDGTEPRTIHLGMDIWGFAGTKVYVPVGGTVHSFAFNEQPGDYGATIVLQHQIETIVFHTLYGHVCLDDISNLKIGKYISRGELLAHFGTAAENGDWPPHLHFQIIRDMRMKKGDYPGVCSVNDAEKFFANCPDPDLIVNMMQFVN
jgi:murein DD-endopeptidase MepM/ murein hydrolase activator NlpD